MTLEPDPIERLLTSGMLDKPLSSLYLYPTVAHEVKKNGSMTKWQEDIPSLGEEEWEECLTTFIPSMIAAKDRFIQLKFIHRAYYTPERLARIYPTLSPKCTRCELDTGTFYHMVWSCPKIRPFWSSVADTLETVCGVEIPLDPLTLLLSHLEDIEGDRYTKLFLTYSLFYARREILLKWKQQEAQLKKHGKKRQKMCYHYTVSPNMIKCGRVGLIHVVSPGSRVRLSSENLHRGTHSS